MNKTLAVVSSKTKSEVAEKRLEFVDHTNRGPDNRSWRNVEALLKWLDVKVRRNDFTGQDEVDGEILSDDILIWVLDEAHRNDLRVSRDFLLERVKAMALTNAYHPVRKYFDGLKWDGEPRLDEWLATYLGADDSEYVRAVGSLMLIAAVRRVRRPGTKFDTLLILEGTQGTGKSTALETLAIKKEWFTDCVSLKHDSKTIIEQTEGKLIVEIPELSGMRHAEVEHVKANLSRTHDRARKAYDRLTTEVARQFVMIATANVDDEGKAAYLKDHTGNRRFWPVQTDEIDIEGLKEDRDQLWAEAVMREAKGESIALPHHLWARAERRQNARMATDPYYHALRDALGDQEGKVLVENIWAFLGKKPGQVTQTDLDRVGRVMRKLGWRRIRRRYAGKLRYHYIKGDEPHEAVSLLG